MIRSAADMIGTALHDLLDLGTELAAAAALLVERRPPDHRPARDDGPRTIGPRR